MVPDKWKGDRKGSGVNNDKDDARGIDDLPGIKKRLTWNCQG